MYRPTFRHAVVVGTLALMAAAPLAACAGDPLAPLPAQTSSSAPAAPASPALSAPASTSARPGASPPRVTTRPTSVKPVHTTTKTTKPTSTCLGAVRYDLDLRNTELALIKSMCFRVGGVLRLQGIGPGLVTWSPESLASHNYEAGVVDLRFIRTGTVTVTIPQDEQTYTITVVVIS